jgi:hypothetical protein
MKRIAMLLIVLLSMISIDMEIHGSANYQTYEDIEMVTGKLLEDFTDKEYKVTMIKWINDYSWGGEYIR